MDPTALIVTVLALGCIAVAALYYYIFTLGGLGKQRSKVEPDGEGVPEPERQPEVHKPIEISSDSSEEEESPPGPPIATAAQNRMDVQAADAAAAAAEAARLAQLMGGCVINGRFVPQKVFVDKDAGIEKKHALVRQRRQEEAARKGLHKQKSHGRKQKKPKSQKNLRKLLFLLMMLQKLKEVKEFKEKKSIFLVMC